MDSGTRKKIKPLLVLKMREIIDSSKKCIAIETSSVEVIYTETDKDRK